MMKKSYIRLLPIVCSIMFLSCEAEPTANSDLRTDDYPPDTSLAGSVYMEIYFLHAAEGSYDGNALQGMEPGFDNFLNVWKESDTEIYLYVASRWGDTDLRIQIREIPLTGKPYDVVFDHTSDDAFVLYDNERYFPHSASVKGWIRAKGLSEKLVAATRSYPAEGGYDCAIEIACTINEKPLTLKITEIVSGVSIGGAD